MPLHQGIPSFLAGRALEGVGKDGGKRMAGVKEQEDVDAPPDGIPSRAGAEDAPELEENRGFGKEHGGSIGYFGEIVPVGEIRYVDEADVPEMTGEAMLRLIDEDDFPKDDASRAQDGGVVLKLDLS